MSNLNLLNSVIDYGDFETVEIQGCSHFYFARVKGNEWQPEGGLDWELASFILDCSKESIIEKLNSL